MTERQDSACSDARDRNNRDTPTKSGCKHLSPQRLSFSSIDRLVFAGLYRLAPGVLDALKIVRPETVIRCIVLAS